MKHPQQVKLGHLAAFVLIAACFIYTACDTKKAITPESEGVIATLREATPYTLADIKSDLRKLLTHLQLNPQIITSEVLAKTTGRHATIAKGRHATINDLGLSQKFPLEFPLENGNTFEVYIELFKGSSGNAVSVEDVETYLILDLDRFPEEAGASNSDEINSFEAHVAATSYNKRQGLYTGAASRRQLAIDWKNPTVDYLLFIVGGEERLSQANQALRYQEWQNSRPGILKAQNNPDTECWWITWMRVFTIKDNFSGDEFELYYGGNGNEGSGFFDVFNSTTGWEFDGENHTDASGNTRFFPDIWGITDQLLMPHPIAIEVLTPDSPAGFKLCAIEDDCSATVHKNEGTGSIPKTLNVYDIDAFAAFTREYYFNIQDNCGDDDDIYIKSGTISFGDSIHNCAASYPSSADVKICLRRGTVAQADAGWPGIPCTAGNCVNL
ncbi:MAG: hypothetical protein ACREOO_24750 [bacterium]